MGIFDKNKLSRADKLKLASDKKTRVKMDANMQSLIATNEHLADRGIKAAQEESQREVRALKEASEREVDAIKNASDMELNAIKDASDMELNAIGDLQREVRAGTEEITFYLEQTVDQLQILNWEMKVMNNFFKEISNSLQGILESVAHTEKAWAYSQFQDAMFAYERELFEEALEYVSRAIKGNSGHTGYALDFRFYNLLGVLRLGSGVNTDSKIVNPKKAKEAFLKSARYSIKDYPHEAANAFLCAGRSAYVEGNMKDALEHTKNAIEINEYLDDAIFQYGKLLYINNNQAEAEPHLKKVILKQPNYALLIAADEDLKPHKDGLERLILECSRILKDKANKLVNDIDFQKGNIINVKNNLKFNEFKNEIGAKCNKYNNGLMRAQDMLNTNTLIGAWEAMRKFNELTYRFSHDAIVAANEFSVNKVEKLKEKIKKELDELKKNLENKKINYEISRTSTGSNYSKFIGKVAIGAYLLLIIVAFTIDYSESIKLYEGLFNSDAPLVFVLIFGGALIWILGRIFGSILGTIISAFKPRIPKYLMDEEEVLRKREDEQKKNIMSDIKLIDKIKHIGERLYDALTGKDDNEPVQRIKVKTYQGTDSKKHLSESIGIGKSGDVMNIFKKGIGLPVKSAKSFSTIEDNAEKIEIILSEGEDRTEDKNSHFCDVVINGLAKKSSGKSDIEISFNIDKEGYFFITAKDKKFAGNELKIFLNRRQL